MKIKDKLKKISNDFSEEGVIFKEKTGSDLLSEKSFKKNATQLSVSIIMPAFRSHNTIAYAIKSILRQSFTKRGGKIEVIIIDDHSRPPLLNKIEKYNFRDILNIKYIYSFRNRGAGVSRDKAIKIAENDVAIFIDSDIVPPSSFIDNHLLIHSVLPKNNIVVSFRENASLTDRRILGLQSWPKGNMDFGDHRTNMTFKQDWVMRPSERKFVNKKFEILKKTNYFKDFGFDRKYFMWTLPMMVMTCAMSVPIEIVKKAIPTPKKLYGWGFNDTCMAARMIASGVKVIPNLNSTVLHILEKKHTKSNEVKNKEFLKNEKIYNKLLEQEYNE